jgi:hypothetical protein
MALFFIVPAAVAGFVGVLLLRPKRNGSRSGQSLT